MLSKDIVSMLDVKCLLLENFNGLQIPTQATAGSAGIDLVAAIENSVTIPSMQRAIIPTGIALEIPKGFEAQIRSRSGLCAKYGVMVLNSPGTIDPDYRGEIKVILMNFGDCDFTINRGDRIAQMVIAQYSNVSFVVAEKLSTTVRDKSGFGSTGI